MLTELEIVSKAVAALEDKKGTDIKILRIREITELADFFVICTATSTTHVKTLCDEVERVLSEQGEMPLRREGRRTGSWLLLDFACVVVHIFLKEAREFYNLEHLWADAEEVELSSLIGPKAAK